jgi:hypothetical protein
MIGFQRLTLQSRLIVLIIASRTLWCNAVIVFVRRSDVACWHAIEIYYWYNEQCHVPSDASRLSATVTLFHCIGRYTVAARAKQRSYHDTMRWMYVSVVTWQLHLHTVYIITESRSKMMGGWVIGPAVLLPISGVRSVCSSIALLYNLYDILGYVINWLKCRVIDLFSCWITVISRPTRQLTVITIKWSDSVVFAIFYVCLAHLLNHKILRSMYLT